MERILNYIGQVRLYSLVDLILLLVATGTGFYQLLGAVILHLAFLAYLESRHAHPYRLRVPSWISAVLAIIGAIFYSKIEALFYLFFSFLYTQKTKNLAPLSPVFRGLQSLFLVGGITGYERPLPYIVAGLLFLRNILGDLRDVEKDKKDGMRTIPIILGSGIGVKYIHLVFLVATSCVWWYISSIPPIYLFLVILVEVSTYNLTPR